MSFKPYMMQKMEAVFDFLDIDKDGVLKMEEFMEFPAQLLKCGEVNTGIALARVYKEHWDRVCDINNQPHDRLTIDKESWAKGHKVISESEWFMREFTPIVSTAFFDSMDTNRDNSISLEEWRVYYHRQGTKDEKFIRNAFDKMDTNGDGFISRDEFDQALRKFNLCHVPGEDCAFLYMRF